MTNARNRKFLTALASGTSRFFLMNGKAWERDTKRLVTVNLAVVFGIYTAAPAWATSPTGGVDLSTMYSGLSITPSGTQLTSVGQGSCSQQYTNQINLLSNEANDASYTGFVGTAAGLVSAGIGLKSAQVALAGWAAEEGTQAGLDETQAVA